MNVQKQLSTLKQMAFEYIIKNYKVLACIGRRVVVDGEAGVIVEDRGSYIGVLFDNQKPNCILNCHPTWEVEYQGMGEVRKMTRSQKRYQEYLKQCDYNDQSFVEWLGIDPEAKQFKKYMESIK